MFLFIHLFFVVELFFLGGWGVVCFSWLGYVFQSTHFCCMFIVYFLFSDVVFFVLSFCFSKMLSSFYISTIVCLWLR